MSTSLLNYSKMQRYKKLISASIAILLAVAAFGAGRYAMQARALDQTLLTSPEQDINVSGRPGETKYCELSVKNVSLAKLKIMGVVTSCGCILITTQLPHEMQPDEVFAIKFAINLHDSQGKTERKRIALLVNKRGNVPQFIVSASNVF